MGKNAIDLTDKTFGRLTVIKRVPSHKKSHCAYWLCRCECGKFIEARSSSLIQGHTTSCGCYLKELRGKMSTKHNGYGTRLYNIWQGMKKRCYNIDDKDYHNYGRRGIIICEEWKDDFTNFQLWAIKNGYTDLLTIDRINNNGNYEPSNCRWVSIEEQNNNKRNTRFVTYNKETHPVSYWLKKQNISKSCFYGRIKEGWSDLEALELVKRDFKNKPYSKEEDDYIMSSNLPIKEIAQKLNRTCSAIYTRRKNLKQKALNLTNDIHVNNIEEDTERSNTDFEMGEK